MKIKTNDIVKIYLKYLYDTIYHTMIQCSNGSSNEW